MREKITVVMAKGRRQWLTNANGKKVLCTESDPTVVTKDAKIRRGLRAGDYQAVKPSSNEVRRAMASSPNARVGVTAEE